MKLMGLVAAAAVLVSINGCKSSSSGSQNDTETKDAWIDGPLEIIVAGIQLKQGFFGTAPRLTCDAGTIRKDTSDRDELRLNNSISFSPAGSYKQTRTAPIADPLLAAYVGGRYYKTEAVANDFSFQYTDGATVIKVMPVITYDLKSMTAALWQIAPESKLLAEKVIPADAKTIDSWSKAGRGLVPLLEGMTYRLPVPALYKYDRLYGATSTPSLVTTVGLHLECYNSYTGTAAVDAAALQQKFPVGEGKLFDLRTSLLADYLK